MIVYVEKIIVIHLKEFNKTIIIKLIYQMNTINKEDMNITKKTFTLIIPLIFILIIISGCSESDENANKIDKITDTEKIFTIDDLIKTGFKKNKTYKTDDLPGANSAYYGFTSKKDSNGKRVSVDYEVRFFDSHEDAKNIGVSLVEERVGKDAKLTKNDATWKEGVKEARTCGGDSGHGKGYSLVVASSTCNLAKYNDYYIYGNMILLCQGKDDLESQKNCNEILLILENPRP